MLMNKGRLKKKTLRKVNNVRKKWTLYESGKFV